MATFPGIYRAKAVSLTGSKLTAFIPQVFGNTSVVIQDYAGVPTTGMGWVAFHGGNAEMPVWIGADVPPSPVDARYVSVTGDDMSGTLIFNTGTTPSISSNKTGAANVDGAIHIEILSAGTQVGRITRATSSTAGFLTTSDEQLKSNMVPVEDDLALLWMRSIEPYFFDYTVKPGVRHVGYSAQEVAALWPNGISNGIIFPGHGDINARTWDSAGIETTPREVWEPWMMDHGKITPILHSGMLAMDRIQTARTIVIADHEARLVSLESKVAAQANQITALLATTAQQASQITALQQEQVVQNNQIAINQGAATTNTTLVSQLRSDLYYTRRTMTYWQYANQATGPAASGQMRTSSPTLNTMWLHRIDDGGYDRDNFLRTIVERTTMDLTSVRFRVSGATGSMFELRSTAAATYDGTVCTIPVAVIAGTAGAKGFRAEVTILTQVWAATTPPTGPTYHDPSGPL